jgi:hypothetical protein
MTQHSTTAEAIEPTKAQDPDRLPTKKVIAVALVALSIFGLSVLWADDILGLETRKLLPNGPAPAPSQVGKREVGMVNQLLFELQTDAAIKREEQLKRLESYGWVDRDTQIIHIPISSAMEQMAAEARR